jgi:hypothetical protein
MACLNVGLLASLSMRPRWPRFVFPIVLFGFTLLLKWAITSAQFSSLHALDWLTEGAYLGLLLGGIFLFFALFFSESNRRTIALVAIILVLIMIHIMPINPYYIDVLKNWRHGNWQQFDHVMQWLAQIWPYLALVYLLTKRPR